MLYTIWISLREHLANWTALAIAILILRKTLDRQYESFRDDQTHMQRFAARASELLEQFSETIIKNQSTIMLEIKNTGRTTTDQILTAVAEMSTANNEATGNVVLALQFKENRTVEAIEKLLIALREDLATMRPAPPVGGTGSQVRDGGAVP